MLSKKLSQVFLSAIFFLNKFLRYYIPICSIIYTESMIDINKDWKIVNKPTFNNKCIMATESRDVMAWWQHCERGKFKMPAKLAFLKTNRDIFPLFLKFVSKVKDYFFTMATLVIYKNRFKFRRTSKHNI